MKIDTLLQLRQQIDQIDDQIIALLKSRVEVVKEVGKLKKQTLHNQSFIRAGREAVMLRNLTSKAAGVLPAAAIATIWRMVISASLGIEQNILIYTYSGNSNDKNCFWLAREYFGTFLEMHNEENIETIIDNVSKDAAAIAVLPLIDNSQKPWWIRPENEINNIYVFARIPFILEDSTIFSPALAIANTAPEATEDDISLFSISTDIGLDKLKMTIENHGMLPNIISRSGKNNFLLEVNRFVQIGDDVIRHIVSTLGENSKVRLLGSYAAPIKL